MAAGRDGLSFMVEDPSWRAFLARHPRVEGAVIPVGVLEPDVARIGPEARADYRRSLGIPEGARIVGTIGRFAPERQTHRYADIFARVAREAGPDVHFLVGGDGPDRPLVEAGIARHGLGGRVHLAGLVQDIDTAFAVMDFYITSNVGPVCGVAGLQAVAAGLPAVALQLVPTYGEGASDWIWSSPDPEAVGARVAALLNDPEASTALAREQGDYLRRHHSAAAMAEGYEALYRKAIARARGPAAAAAA
jgi:glycosyltransferase involved in cell wall biosynthesis